jgi:hypothetical protein
MSQINCLEDEIINKMGQNLCNEIDFQILTDMLVAIGWTKVILKPMTMEDGYAVDLWTDQHVHKPFETMGLVWVFEDPAEANWFALRWL